MTTDEKQAYQLICSYLKEGYFISTAYRRSSAATQTEMWYFETIVWKWDKKKKKCGKMLDMQESGIGEMQAIENHFETVKNWIND